MSLEEDLAAGRGDAVEKFFTTPELVEKLLLFLDLKSTKQLAEAHVFTRKILRKPFTWDKLIKRTLKWDTQAWVKAQGRRLAAILTTILSDSESENEEIVKDPKLSHLLLHTMCKRLPSFWSSARPVPDVVVRCFCLQTHRVSSYGFLALEEIEATLDQKDIPIGLEVDKVRSPQLEEGGTWPGTLTALASMVDRQSRPVKELDVQDFGCSSEKSAKAVFTLVEKSQAMLKNETSESWIFIHGEIGTEGWAAIRRAAETLSGKFQLEVILDSYRKTLACGKREDLKAIWYIASQWDLQLCFCRKPFGPFCDISYKKDIYGNRGGWEGVRGRHLQKSASSRYLHSNFTALNAIPF